MSCSPVKCCPDNTLCPRSAPAEKQLKVRSQMIMLNLPEFALGKMPATAKRSNQKTPVSFSSPRLFLRFKVSKFSAALGYLLEVPWIGQNALLGKKNKKRTPAPAGDSDRKLPSTISYNFKTRWWYNIVSHPAPSSYNEQVNNACWTFSGPQAVPPQTKKSQHSSCFPDVWSHDALGTQIVSQSFGAPFHTYWVLAPLRIFWNLGERGDARFRRTTLEFERFVKAVVWIKMCFEDCPARYFRMTSKLGRSCYDLFAWHVPRFWGKCCRLCLPCTGAAIGF